MSLAFRLIRALLLVAFVCAAGRVFSGPSAHAHENEITSHHSKIPFWINEAERQSQATLSDVAVPAISGIAPGSPNLASAVIPSTTSAVCRTREAVLRQRPPPPHSSI